MQPGEIFGEAFDLYKRFWRHFIPIALIVFLIVSVASLLLALALGSIGALFGVILALVGVFWLQGAIAEAVNDVRDGRADLSVGETLNRVGPRVATLGAAGLLAGLAIFVGLLLLLVPGLYLLTIWSVISPVIVLEKAGVFESFGRSRQLVSGHGWQVFGVIALSFVIVIGAGLAVSLALIWLPDAVRSFLQSLISNTLVAPFIAAAWTVMYFRLRGEPATEPGPAPA
ncbi:MAG: hypothetical protein ABR583_04105 [Gaiellaceae bacterium]